MICSICGAKLVTKSAVQLHPKLSAAQHLEHVARKPDGAGDVVSVRIPCDSSLRRQDHRQVEDVGHIGEGPTHRLPVATGDDRGGVLKDHSQLDWCDPKR